MPKNATCPQPGLEPQPFEVESGTLSLKPLHLLHNIKVIKAIYLKGNNQKRYSDGHSTERCYKPGHPVYGIG